VQPRHSAGLAAVAQDDAACLELPRRALIGLASDARPPWPVECRVGRTPLFLAAELVQPLLQFIELPLEIFHLTAAALRFAL